MWWYPEATAVIYKKPEISKIYTIAKEELWLLLQSKNTRKELTIPKEK